MMVLNIKRLVASAGGMSMSQSPSLIVVIARILLKQVACLRILVIVREAPGSFALTWLSIHQPGGAIAPFHKISKVHIVARLREQCSRLVVSHLSWCQFLLPRCLIAMENLRDANALVRLYIPIESRDLKTDLIKSYVSKDDTSVAPSHLVFACSLLRVCEKDARTGPLFSWLLRSFKKELDRLPPPQRQHCAFLNATRPKLEKRTLTFSHFRP